jgi:hypothetical protein
LNPRSDRVVAKNAARLFLVFVFSVGALHASPITFVGQAQLQNPKQLNVHGSAPLATKETVEATVLPTHPNSWNQVHPSSVSCTIASACSAPLEVPEPGSLLLVGTGFLSAAGLIRRRLFR